MNGEELLKVAKPILFNTEMTQATLDDRKTATRRVIKPQPVNGIRKSVFVPYGLEDGHGREIKPKYKIGDILYVRETWQCINPYSDKEYVYKASCNEDYASDIGKWLPSIHMPKEAARIFLKVTDVWAERLQDITSEQAKNEGVNLNSGTPFPKVTARDCHGAQEGLSTYQSKFVILWDSTVKKQDLDKYCWKANPWVWVIEFERVMPE